MSRYELTEDTTQRFYSHCDDLGLDPQETINKWFKEFQEATYQGISWDFNTFCEHIIIRERHGEG